MTGIITINDLVEQLVGDLSGEDAEEEKEIEAVGEGTWKVRGSALLEDLEKELGIALPCEEYDTFNGLIFTALGSIPEEGGDIEIEVSGLQVKVTEIKNCQIEAALVYIKPKTDKKVGE